MLLLILAPDAAYRRASLNQLSARLDTKDAQRIWSTAVKKRLELKSQRQQSSMGVAILLRYMEWSGALYRAALRHGWPPDQAGALVEEVNWSLFGPAGLALFKLSRLRSAAAQVRMAWTYDLMFRWLFTAPFKRRMVSNFEGVAFDVTLCPLANYFRTIGHPELTRSAACSFDACLAKTCGLTFRQTQTIAQGGEFCDFRFINVNIKRR